MSTPSAPSAPPESIAFEPVIQTQDQDQYYFTDQEPLRAGQPPPFAPPHLYNLEFDSSSSQQEQQQQQEEPLVVIPDVSVDEVIIQEKAKMIKIYGFISIMFGIIGLLVLLARFSSYEVPIGIIFGLISIQASRKKTICWARANYYIYMISLLLCVIAGIIFVSTSVYTCPSYGGTCGRIGIVICFFVFPLICFLPCVITGSSFMHAIARRDGLEAPLEQKESQIQMNVHNP